MPSKTKAQQGMMGAAYAAKSGKAPMSSLQGPAKSAAKSMSKQQLKDFASTPSKGLPLKAKAKKPGPMRFKSE